MKVLFVCHVYPRHADDHQAAFMHDLARLAARRHEVVVLAPHDAGLPMEESRDGVRIVRFRYAAPEKETLAYRGDMHEQVLGSPARALLFARFLRTWRRAVRQAIASERPDLVHIHWWVPGGLVARGACRRAGVPYVVSSHGTDVFLLRKLPVARPVARRIFDGAAGVHVVSSAIRDELGRVAPEAARRAHVFTMPADLEGLAGRRHPVPGRILFVGRLVERKGVRVLVEAVRMLAAEGRDVTLQVVGDGPERARLEARSAGAPVEFLGPVSREALEEAYRAASLFCLPSLTTRRGEAEGLGVVLLEAQAVGVPVVATRNGGIVDAVIDGETGLLVPEGDAPALAHAIARLLDDRRLATRLTEAATRRLPAVFGHDAIAARLDDLYREAKPA